MAETKLMEFTEEEIIILIRHLKGIVKVFEKKMEDRQNADSKR